MASSTFDLAALTLSDPVTGAKGAKLAPLSCAGKPVVWQPEAQFVVYEPSAFQNEEATRVNLVMRASPQAVTDLTDLDDRILELCALQSINLFGKALTSEELRLRYTPCLKPSTKGYEPTFKVKVNMSGRGKLKCWDPEAKQRDPPHSWIGCSVKPRVVARSLWIMPKEFGCLLECSDVLIDEAEPQCPF